MKYPVVQDTNTKEETIGFLKHLFNLSAIHLGICTLEQLIAVLVYDFNMYISDLVAKQC